MNIYNNVRQDNGGSPDSENIEQITVRNTNFRTAVWAGSYMQMTVMCIPVCGDIGLEIHPQTDQFIRIEQGNALAEIGKCKGNPDFQCCMKKNDAVFIPAGTWHNITNTGKIPLKVSVIYAPPHHPKGTVHPTKESADY